MGGTYQDILSSGKVESVIAGSNITIDITDPANPIINGIVNNTIVVANYSALPAVGTVTGKFYWCSASQGTNWLPGSWGGTFYNSGLYYSNGVTWEFLNVPYNATQSEVNTGTNTDKFVTPNTFFNSTKWATKEPTITGTTSVDFWTGAKTWVNFATTALATILTGYVKGAGTISAADSIKSAIQKLDGNIDLKGSRSTLDSLIFTGSYMPIKLGYTTSSTTAGVNGYLIAQKNTPRETCTIIGLSAYCNTPDATGYIRINIFADLNGKPGALLADTGNISCATTGHKEGTISALTLTEGTIYHTIIQVSSGTISLRYNPNTEKSYYDATTANYVYSLLCSYSFGAPPSTFPTTITFYYDNPAFNIYILMKQQ